MSDSAEREALSAELRRFVECFPRDAGRAAEALDFVESTPAGPTARSNMQGHFTGSAFVLNPVGDATLLIFHKRLGRWLQPGGHIDPGESPVEAARREAYEELGIPAGALHLHPWHDGRAKDESVPIDIDSHPIPANAKKNEQSHVHHDLLYLFVLDATAQLAIERCEVDATKWIPLAELPANDRLHHVTAKLPAFFNR